MGTYLETEVIEFLRDESELNSTKMILAQKGKDERISFELPLRVKVRPGDKISFFHGTITDVPNPYITHNDYVSGKIFRSEDEEMVLSFDARDMKILTEVRNYYGVRS